MKNLLLTTLLLTTISSVNAAGAEKFSEEQKRAALEIQRSMEQFANHLGQLVAMDAVLECKLPVRNLEITYGAYTQALKLPANIQNSLFSRVVRSAETLMNDQRFEQSTKEQMDCEKGKALYTETINHLRGQISHSGERAK